MKYMFRAIAVLALVVFTSPYVMAGSVGAINSFTANTPALAEEVNANFNVLKTEINENDSRIITNATKSSENMAEISLNREEISANGSAITGVGGLDSRITANESLSTTNESNIVKNLTAIDGRLPNIVGTCFDQGKSIQQINPSGSVLCGASSTSNNSVGQDQLKKGIPGVAWSDSSPRLLDSDQDITTVTFVSITPPTSKSGLLVASASAQLHKEKFSIAENVKCGLSKGFPDDPASESWVRLETNNDDTIISLDSVFLFDGAKTDEEIYLLCKRVNKIGEPIPDPINDPVAFANDAAIVLNANLNVIFVPRDYNTTP